MEEAVGATGADPAAHRPQSAILSSFTSHFNRRSFNTRPGKSLERRKYNSQDIKFKVEQSRIIIFVDA